MTANQSTHGVAEATSDDDVEGRSGEVEPVPVMSDTSAGELDRVAAEGPPAQVQPDGR